MEKFELKYMVSEMKNSLHKFNSRLGTGKKESANSKTCK